MNLDFTAGGSPLASRQNPAIYAGIVVGLIIIAIFFAVWYLQKKIKEKKATPEWIEKNASRKTKKSDVNMFAEKYKLSDDESNLLWKICKKYEIQNILYSIKHFADIEHYFAQYYKEICSLNSTSNNVLINKILKLRFRLERIFASSEILKSTFALEKGQHISEIFPDGSKQPFKVYDIKKEHIIIELNENFYNSEEKPEALSKVAFTFHSKTNMRYAFVSRVIRYEINNAGKPLMFISHSSDLIIQQQRFFKRLVTTEKCKISSVKAEKNKKGIVKNVPSEKKIDCALLNISGGGCCISTNLPLKEGQMIYSEFAFPSGSDGSIGKIIKTRKTKTQGIYNLHIQFIDISTDCQNKIMAKVYGYS